ncbi:hypothetical protein ATO6_17730 [Oceanicola sp. 22II-s10i]|nr:hypothetical protein ATO6_17730 [Oceanicola sp. 22II-s10i]
MKIPALLLCLMPAACGEINFGAREPAAEAQDGDGQTRPQARPGTPEAEDAAEVTEVAGEVTTPEAGGRLGVTIASLGNPGEQGLWLKTPLVRTNAKGRVAYGGQSADVDLIPIPGEPGAGSRMSLAAFQALGAPVTGLPEIEVFLK